MGWKIWFKRDLGTNVSRPPKKVLAGIGFPWTKIILIWVRLLLIWFFSRILLEGLFQCCSGKKTREHTPWNREHVSQKCHARYVCEWMLNDHAAAALHINLCNQRRKSVDLSTSKNMTITVYNHNVIYCGIEKRQARSNPESGCFLNEQSVVNTDISGRLWFCGGMMLAHRRSLWMVAW